MVVPRSVNKLIPTNGKKTKTVKEVQKAFRDMAAALKRKKL